MSRYFVTKAAGFIGGTVVRSLVATGHEVITIDRETADGDGQQAPANDEVVPLFARRPCGARLTIC